MPYKHDLSALALLGIIAGDWWSSLGPVKKAFAAILVVGVTAFSAGTATTLLLWEQRGLPARVSVTERRSVRDSIRVDGLLAEQAKDAEMRHKVDEMANTLQVIDDRTRRISCFLSGRNPAACL